MWKSLEEKERAEEEREGGERDGGGGGVVVVVGFEGGRGMDGGLRQTSGRASCSETN